MAGSEEIITVKVKSTLLKMYFLWQKHKHLFIFHTYYDYRQNSNITYFILAIIFRLDTSAELKECKYFYWPFKNDDITYLYSSIWSTKLDMQILCRLLVLFPSELTEIYFPVNIFSLKPRVWESYCGKTLLKYPWNIQSYWLTIFSIA